MEHGCSHDALVAGRVALAPVEADLLVRHAHRLEAGTEGLHKLDSTRPGVAPEDDRRLDGEVDLERAHEPGDDVDQGVGGRGVGERGRVALPGGLEHLALGVDELDSVVDCRVVRRRHHHSDRLASELLGPEDGQDTHAVERRMKRASSGEVGRQGKHQSRSALARGVATTGSNGASVASTHLVLKPAVP